ncbi:MAG TPA: penicillin acylase family protein [Roseiflexaceae bacterium]|nr:penicillin acylase family protein [Roseiflexaceae bacterium]
MASLAKIGKIAGVALGALAGLTGAAAVTALRRPLARTSGQISVPGLSAPVQVLRDRWGVPHIYARTTADLFSAQGYVHAQDRLWQMELQRRTGMGRLAEVFGPIALDTDRFVRVLGFNRVVRREAELLDGEARLVIEAYVRGVNAFIAQNARRLPIEFGILRLHPEPWQVEDVLVWPKMMALNLSRDWMTDLLRARIVAAIGPERAALLEPQYPPAHPLTIPPGVRYSTGMGADALRLATTATPFAGSSAAGQGSNAWAVGGERTESGRPLLASDPHLILQVPSLWYENHLSGGDIHVTGASLPGLPCVVIGHNERIAWGLTNGENSVQDLFIERFDPADPTRYEFQSAWEQATIVREQIVVKGQAEPAIEEVRITRHGPIISSLIPSDERRKTKDEGTTNDASHSSSVVRPSSNEALALRWAALEPGQNMSAAILLNRAHDWDSFRAAVAEWVMPTQNFIYADVDGHIGYMLGGALPIRARGDGLLPVPGWTGEYEWTGSIPRDQLPHMLDPDEGFVASANTQTVGDDYPYRLPGEYLPGYRATRIRQLLTQTPRHDAASFTAIQGDQRSLPGLDLAALAGRLPAPTPVARQAREALAAWDGELTAESIGGAIYARLREKLLREAYGEVAGPLGLVAGLGAFAGLPGSAYTWRGLPQVLERLAARDDSWLPAGRTGDDLLREAWEATIAELSEQLGGDVNAWRYGRYHTLTLRHPLGAAAALAPLLNRGPFPMGGDEDTVRMGNAPRQYAGQPYYVAPSYRQICDLSNWDRSLSIHPIGQSGQPGSKHYADLLDGWRTMQYHPMPWSRARVEDIAAERLTLAPEQD